MKTPRHLYLSLPRWARFVSITLLIVLVINVVLSIISTYFLENYAAELTGRKVTIGSVWVNLLRTTVTINDLKMQEANSEEVFLSFDEFFLNATPLKYLFGTVAASEVYLEGPRINLIMKGDSLNFQDILQRFSGDTTQVSDSTESLEYAIEDIQITGGAFKFVQASFNGTLAFKSIEFVCPEVSSENPVSTFTLATSADTGGEISIEGELNNDSLSYQVSVQSKAFTLDFLLPFIDKILYAKSITGRVDLDLNVFGNFGALEGASGTAALSEFVMTDTAGNASAKCKKIEIVIDSLNALKGNYAIRKAEVLDPYLRFDLTQKGNNLYRTYNASDSTTSGSSQATSEEVNDEYMNFFSLLNDYLYEIGKEYTINSYNIDSVELMNGDIHFNDYTLNQQFNFMFDSLNVSSHQIRSDIDSVRIIAEASLNRSGKFKSQILLNPKRPGDMHVRYSINKLKITDFSPYSEYYVAHPFWDGIVFFESTNDVKNYWLISENHLLVKKLEVGDKLHSKTMFDLPLKLAVSLLKDVNGNVDLNLPLKGNVNDPNFRVMPIIFKVLSNVIVKAVASPYKLLANSVGANEEDLKDIKFNYMQTDLQKRQSKGLHILARVLNQKKDIQVTLLHMSNLAWEKEQFALFDAKKKFYVQQSGKSQLTIEDTISIENLSRLDADFTTFLKSESGLESATPEEMAIKIAGEETLESLLKSVEQKRKENVVQYLGSHVDGPTRYRIVDAKAEDLITYRDRPKFELLYESAGMK